MTDDIYGELYERIRKNLPTDMLEKHRWGILEYEHVPVEKIEPPMWSYTFASISRLHRTLSMMRGVCRDGLGYCFGGTSLISKSSAKDSDHANASDSGKLVMLPETDVACFVYSGVRNPETCDIYPYVVPEVKKEIETTTSRYPNDVFKDEIHVYFPQEPGLKDKIPNVLTYTTKGKTYCRRFLSDEGYVVVTGVVF